MRVLILLLLLPVVPAYGQDGWHVEADPAPWAGRRVHNTEAFAGRLWVFNGSYGANPPPAALRGIWSSVDGKNWGSEGSEPWGQRYDAASLVFNGRMWMLGGQGFFLRKDVWSTVDGIDWTLETPAASWEERRGHAVASFDGRMWVLGGGTSNPAYISYNDTWSSPDGVNWTLEEASAPWAPRMGHCVVVFDNRMWVMGGASGTAPFQTFSDVWSSADGVNWTQETPIAPWGPRVGHRAHVYNGSIRVIGGHDDTPPPDSGFLNDAWYSADGVNWIRQTSAAPWEGRGLCGSAVFNDRLWIAGGRSETNGFHDDVWSYGFHASPDVLPNGIIQEPYSAFLEAREGGGPYLWELIAGSMPPGLALDTSSTAATAAVSGTPGQIGTFIFSIRLTDNNGYTSEQDIQLTIKKALPLQSNKGGNSGCALAGAWAFGPYLLVVAAPAIAAYAFSRRRRRCLWDER
jgi:hypothetical protein